MTGRLLRAGRDLVRLRNVDAYVACAVAVVLAVAGIVGHVPDDVRWSAVLAALAVLIFRSVAPARRADTFDQVADDRASFETRPLSERWRTARRVWIFAPTGINILATENLDVLRRTVLSRPRGSVRIVILDENAHEAIRLAGRHLDDELDFPARRIPEALAVVHEQLETLAGWTSPGAVEVRRIGYNPGFSLVITEPLGAACSVIVEMHGFHHETTASRMHLDLSRDVSERWMAYWVEQYEHMWDRAVPLSG